MHIHNASSRSIHPVSADTALTSNTASATAPKAEHRAAATAEGKIYVRRKGPSGRSKTKHTGKNRHKSSHAIKESSYPKGVDTLVVATDRALRHLKKKDLAYVKLLASGTKPEELNLGAKQLDALRP